MSHLIPYQNTGWPPSLKTQSNTYFWKGVYCYWAATHGAIIISQPSRPPCGSGPFVIKPSDVCLSPVMRSALKVPVLHPRRHQKDYATCSKKASRGLPKTFWLLLECVSSRNQYSSFTNFFFNQSLLCSSNTWEGRGGKFNDLWALKELSEVEKERERDWLLGRCWGTHLSKPPVPPTGVLERIHEYTWLGINSLEVLPFSPIITQ